MSWDSVFFAPAPPPKSVPRGTSWRPRGRLGFERVLTGSGVQQQQPAHGACTAAAIPGELARPLGSAFVGCRGPSRPRARVRRCRRCRSGCCREGWSPCLSLCCPRPSYAAAAAQSAVAATAAAGGGAATRASPGGRLAYCRTEAGLEAGKEPRPEACCYSLGAVKTKRVSSRVAGSSAAGVASQRREQSHRPELLALGESEHATSSSAGVPTPQWIAAWALPLRCLGARALV